MMEKKEIKAMLVSLSCLRSLQPHKSSVPWNEESEHEWWLFDDYSMGERVEDSITCFYITELIID